MNKDKKAKDPRRNHIFAEAVDHLKRTQGFTTQKELAEKMGVPQERISHIIQARTNVTEDSITRLQTASGCIFNLQWLRGESDIMLAADLPKKEQESTGAGKDVQAPDVEKLINIVTSAKNDEIAALKREIASKEETIAALRETISTKDAFISSLQQQLSDVRMQLALQKGLLDGRSLTLGSVEQHERPALV